MSIRHFAFTASTYTSHMESFQINLFTVILLGHIFGLYVSAICPSMWTPTGLTEAALADKPFSCLDNMAASAQPLGLCSLVVHSLSLLNHFS